VLVQHPEATYMPIRPETDQQDAVSPPAPQEHYGPQSIFTPGPGRIHNQDRPESAGIGGLDIFLSKRYASPAGSGTSHVYKMICIARSVHMVDRVSVIVTQCICHCDKMSWVPRNRFSPWRNFSIASALVRVSGGIRPLPMHGPSSL
jgi:hypothetical protein